MPAGNPPKAQSPSTAERAGAKGNGMGFKGRRVLRQVTQSPPAAASSLPARGHGPKLPAGARARTRGMGAWLQQAPPPHQDWRTQDLPPFAPLPPSCLLLLLPAPEGSLPVTSASPGSNGPSLHGLMGKLRPKGDQEPHFLSQGAHWGGLVPHQVPGGSALLHSEPETLQRPPDWAADCRVTAQIGASPPTHTPHPLTAAEK